MRLGNPWFVASDACDGLALSNVSEALADLDDEDKLKLTKDGLDTSFQMRYQMFIKLLKRGVVTETRNLVSVMLPDSLGRECIKTTLYDLKVFNYLVMRLDTDQAL